MERGRDRKKKKSERMVKIALIPREGASVLPRERQKRTTKNRSFLLVVVQRKEGVTVTVGFK